jgi:hypothetical protein
MLHASTPCTSSKYQSCELQLRSPNPLALSCQVAHCSSHVLLQLAALLIFHITAQPPDRALSFEGWPSHACPLLQCPSPLHVP